MATALAQVVDMLMPLSCRGSESTLQLKKLFLYAFLGFIYLFYLQGQQTLQRVVVNNDTEQYNEIKKAKECS